MQRIKSMTRRTVFQLSTLLKNLLVLLPTSIMMAPAVHASNNLIFSFWSNASAPFAIVQHGQLQGGIIQELAIELGKRAGFRPKFQHVPVKRIEELLRNGGIHVDCVTNPMWKESPEIYTWSPILFNGADRFIVRKNSSLKIDTFDDLRGKSIGVYNGYIYNPQITSMFNSGQAKAVQVIDISHGIQLVELARLDTLIDFGVLLKYEIKSKKLNDQLTLANLHADDYTLHCAYSPHIPMDTDQLNLHLQNMKEEGVIESILRKYE